MTTAKELLKKLNEMRIENGKKPLKSCKDSKAKIQKMIDIESDLQMKVILGEAFEEFENIHPDSFDPEDETEVFKVTELAIKLSINPKIARRRLRDADKKPDAVMEGKWVFDIKDIKAIVKIISGGKTRITIGGNDGLE